MSYETYEPGGPTPEQDTTSYDVYEPGGSTYRSAVGSGSRSRSSSSYRGGSSTSSSGATAGRVIGGVVGLVAAIVGIAQAGSAGSTPDTPNRSGYAACADAHDENSSLFTDAEWCIDGPGGSYDVSDSSGYDPDPYGLDDPYDYDSYDYGGGSTYP